MRVVPDLHPTASTSSLESSRFSEDEFNLYEGHAAAAHAVEQAMGTDSVLFDRDANRSVLGSQQSPLELLSTPIRFEQILLSNSTSADVERHSHSYHSNRNTRAPSGLRRMESGAFSFSDDRMLTFESLRTRLVRHQEMYALDWCVSGSRCESCIVPHSLESPRDLTDAILRQVSPCTEALS